MDKMNLCIIFVVIMMVNDRSQGVSHSELMVEDKKCQMLCKIVPMEEQCVNCNTRMPIRFGKRSQEIEVNLHTFLNARQPPENEYFAQMLMKRFLPLESNMFNFHLKY